MNEYTDFALVYDELMDDIPYGDWAYNALTLLKKAGVLPGSRVADLGCGTGTMTRLLAAFGEYRMIGIDLSEEMLRVAEKRNEEWKAGEEGNEDGPDEEPEETQAVPCPVYLHQDMRGFTLDGQVDAVVSFCDSVNYLTTVRDLRQMLACVRSSLPQGGVFIFDYKTEHMYRDVIGDDTIAESRDDCAFVWENEYNSRKRLNTYYLTLFRRCDEEGRLFERSYEEHTQRGYRLEEIIDAAKREGFVLVKAYDADHFPKGPSEAESERILVELKKR